MTLNIYAVLLGLGASVGCWQIIHRIRHSERARWSTFLLLALLAALFGARTWYVIQMGLTSGQWLPFLAVWQGGLSWPGAVLGFVLAAAVFIIVIDAPSAVLFDLLLPLYVLLPVTALLGCWPVGCAYGLRLPEGAFFGLRTLDETGVVSERLPLQFLAVILLLGLTALLLYLQRKGRIVYGQLTSGYAAGLGLVLLLVTLLRADVQPRLGGLPIDAWAALTLILGGVIAWVFCGIKYGNKKEKQK